MSGSSINKPRLVIRPWVWDKMMFMARNKEALECSGLGVVTLQGNNFVVEETFMVPQQNTSSDTEMDADAIGKELFLRRNDPGFVKWHWHSHVNMGVFWSGGDHELIAKNCSQGWFVHTVINVRGEKKSCVGQMKPFPFFIDDIETVIEAANYPEETYASWQEEYNENAKRKTYTSSTTYGNSEPARVLPASVPYGDRLDRHTSKASDTPGDPGSVPGQEDAQGNILNATELDHQSIVRHLERRLERQKQTEDYISLQITDAPHDTDLHQQYLKCLADIEETEDLIHRMREKIDDAAQEAIEKSMTSPDAQDAAMTAMTEGASV